MASRVADQRLHARETCAREGWQKKVASCRSTVAATPGHHRTCKQGMGSTLGHRCICKQGMGNTPGHHRICKQGMGSTPGRRQTFVVINTAAITLAHLPLRSEAIAPTITISNKTTTGTTTPDHLQTPNQAITMTVTAGTLDQRPNFEDTMVAFPGRHRISRCLKVNPTAGWKHQCIKIPPRQLQTHH